MNTYSLESFISFCDDMQIAEESYKSINDLYKKLQTELEKVNYQIKTENDIRKLIELCKKKKDLILQVKTQIMKEPESGFSNITAYLKNLLLPAIFAALAGVIAADKKNVMKLKKSDKMIGIGTFASLSVLSGYANISDIRQGRIKLSKNNVIKIIDEQIENTNEAIEFYKEALKNGLETRTELSTNDISEKDSADMISIKRKRLQTNNLKNNLKQKISQFASKPLPEKTTVNKDINYMENDVFLFMKKYTSTPEFKKKYKKYLHMIDIEITDYSQPFSITFTPYQNGEDDRIITEWKNNHPGEEYSASQYERDTEWYDELMDVCEEYINIRFKDWKNYIWKQVSFGDGDEGTIYVEN